MKANKFWISFLACFIAIILLGGIAVFSIPSLQAKLADSIVEKSQKYKDTCAELSHETERADALEESLSNETSEKDDLQDRYDSMEEENANLLAQISELLEELGLYNQIVDNLTFDLTNLQAGSNITNDINIHYVRESSGLELYVYTDQEKTYSTFFAQENLYDTDTMNFLSYMCFSKSTIIDLMNRSAMEFGGRLTYIDYYSVYTQYCGTAVRLFHPIEYDEDFTMQLGNIYVDGVQVSFSDFVDNSAYDCSLNCSILFEKTLDANGVITGLTFNYYITTDNTVPTVII